MPTLVPALDSQAKNVSSSRNDRIEGDESITIFNEDDSTIVGENYRRNSSSSYSNNSDSVNQRNNESRRSILSSSSRRVRIEKSVTFDESTMILTSPTEEKERLSRRDTLNSDVSLSLLSCDNTMMKESSVLLSESNTDRVKHGTCTHSIGGSDQIRNWSRRDEYCTKYQLYVKEEISNFESQFPGKLMDYRSMSDEEKQDQQQKVLALLRRLGVSKSAEVGSTMAVSQSVHTPGCFKSPTANSDILDQTMSPFFSPNPHPSCDHDRNVDLSLSDSEDGSQKQKTVHHDQSQTICDKSELLLSMEGDPCTSRVDSKRDSMTHDSGSPPGIDPVGYQFPVNNDNDNTDDNVDDDDKTSTSSMELVRQAATEDPYHHSDQNSSCMTPKDRKISGQSCRKREATTSGKRGADLRRPRHNREEEESDLSTRLGRLSISPSVSTPPKDLFITSQSPISPRLTYHTPDENESYGHHRDDYGGRISLGTDSDDIQESTLQKSRRESDIANESLASNTPPTRYRIEKEKRRAFREVPVNVALKKGATFHLEKIAVKRTERIASKPVTSTANATKPMKRRRLVNFPDPLVRYGSRKRRALKEMYTWVRRAERDFEQGKCNAPAVGTFFSLSNEEIIDLSLKLFLSDYAENSDESNPQSSQSTSVLRGNTLVVLRAKEDSANWENALREGTGCSVLNHASLPLSARIRASTSEKACLHDVILTTYDAIKSPDVAIPLTADGHAIVTKSSNDGGWHSTRSSQEDHKIQRQNKQLSILHRIEFKRTIFVDKLGRKSYLAKSGTARAAASVAITSSSSRLVFFEETEADGSNALLALRKSDKRAFQSVSSVLRLTEKSDESVIAESSDDDDHHEDPFEQIVMDLKDLIY